jgi:hypothetical protein
VFSFLVSIFSAYRKSLYVRHNGRERRRERERDRRERERETETVESITLPYIVTIFAVIAYNIQSFYIFSRRQYLVTNFSHIAVQ